MSSPILLRVSTPNWEVARTIADQLVTRRLAAAVHIIGPVETTYWWQDKIENGLEWACEVRTREALKDQVVALITDLHPYEVPEVFFQRIQSATAEYQAWLTQYTSGEES